jgi:DNA-binding NarL/FixJ family response regulator
MPEMDGFETMTALHLQWPGVKALVLTTYNEEYYIIEMINRGANGYLLKSCHPEEIKTALIAIKQNGYYYSETATLQFFNKVRNGMAKLPHFTDNETEFMKYCPSRLSYEEIAVKMGTTYKSVLGYRDRLYEKLDINNRVSLAMFAIQFGFAQVGAGPKPGSIFLKNKK